MGNLKLILRRFLKLFFKRFWPCELNPRSRRAKEVSLTIDSMIVILDQSFHQMFDLLYYWKDQMGVIFSHSPLIYCVHRVDVALEMRPVLPVFPFPVRHPPPITKQSQRQGIWPHFCQGGIVLDSKAWKYPRRKLLALGAPLLKSDCWVRSITQCLDFCSFDEYPNATLVGCVEMN